MILHKSEMLNLLKREFGDNCCELKCSSRQCTADLVLCQKQKSITIAFKVYFYASPILLAHADINAKYFNRSYIVILKKYLLNAKKNGLYDECLKRKIGIICIDDENNNKIEIVLSSSHKESEERSNLLNKLLIEKMNQ